MNLTLDEFLTRQNIDSKLKSIINTIASSSKIVGSLVRKSTLKGNIGLSGSTNSTGDDVQKLDELSNGVFLQSLSHCTYVKHIVSEEESEPIKNHDSGSYLVAIDPLDGSSNIDVNVTIGTIFGIFSHLSPHQDLAPNVSGYVMYGSATIMILAVQETVHMFTLNPSVGEYFHTYQNVTVPHSGAVYSINEGNSLLWKQQGLQTWVQERKRAGNIFRYVGSMIADCHRTLIKGGVFVYPEDDKNSSGKLRSLYEAIPMAHIFESAKGAALTTSGKRILDIKIDNIHHRTSVVIGSEQSVNEVINHIT